MGRIRLSGRGRRRVVAGHPWIFADDIADGTAEPGELVPVADPSGASLGWALYSRASKIALRMVSRSEAQPDREFWLDRVRRAIAWRAQNGLLAEDGACRLIAGDADGIPGLVVDRYARSLVLQSGTQAADRMRGFVIELVDEALPFPIETLVDRSDATVRRLEELQPRVEVLRGTAEKPVLVREGAAVYEVDVLAGQKTGAYLDQRNNRLATAARAHGRAVLDAFAYEGLFGIQAALAGAERVLCLEQSRTACERALANAQKNGVADRVEIVRASCMNELRSRADMEERFGIVVVDPPPFARNKREVEGAERGYVELNRRAFALLGPESLLVSASCSYHVLPERFLDHLRTAAELAGRPAWLLDLAGASPDHPQLLALPETRYLKCAFVRVG
jgi:23S rRNA (cytosine1962-C5)-methyltransferase